MNMSIPELFSSHFLRVRYNFPTANLYDTNFYSGIFLNTKLFVDA
jgi:hypothetical protein